MLNKKIVAVIFCPPNEISCIGPKSSEKILKVKKGINISGSACIRVRQVRMKRVSERNGAERGSGLITVQKPVRGQMIAEGVFARHAGKPMATSQKNLRGPYTIMYEKDYIFMLLSFCSMNIASHGQINPIIDVDILVCAIIPGSLFKL